MIKNNSMEGRNLPEKIKNLISDYKNIYKYIIPSADYSSKKTASPSLKQTFLHNLWLRFESIQDQIKDQDSLKLQFFEFLSPILFNAWIKSGGDRIPNLPFFCGCSFGSLSGDTCSIQGQCPNRNNAPIEPNLTEYQECLGDCSFCGGRN